MSLQPMKGISYDNVSPLVIKAFCEQLPLSVLINMSSTLRALTIHPYLTYGII